MGGFGLFLRVWCCSCFMLRYLARRSVVVLVVLVVVGAEVDSLGGEPFKEFVDGGHGCIFRRVLGWVILFYC